MSVLVASGVHDLRSLGIHRYVGRLAAALAAEGVDYRPVSAPSPGTLAHLHLGNSSRRVVWQALRLRVPYLLTVHDVLPRSAALRLFYRACVYPLCIRRAAAVIVHSHYAADLLTAEAGVDPARITVVAHPASIPCQPLTAAGARRALDLSPDGPPLYVLPGVIKSAKLVREVVAAAAPLLGAGRVRLLLAGRIDDEDAAAAARAAGAHVLANPDDRRYEQAVLAADLVLCLRAGSVGETNGPVLDALGAGKPLLATAGGSIPEVAAGAACYLAADAGVEPLREALALLADPLRRAPLAAVAGERRRELAWSASAAAHATLLGALDTAPPARRSSGSLRPAPPPRP